MVFVCGYAALGLHQVFGCGRCDTNSASKKIVAYVGSNTER
jgi:hypothetical protein